MLSVFHVCFSVKLSPHGPYGVELRGTAAVLEEEEREQERGGREGRGTVAEPVCGRIEREGSGRLRAAPPCPTAGKKEKTKLYL